MSPPTHACKGQGEEGPSVCVRLAESLADRSPMACKFDGGVVMGADSRVSTGTYIANRVSDKVAYLHDTIYMCRSGSAADTQAVSDYVTHFLNQHR